MEVIIYFLVAEMKLLGFGYYFSMMTQFFINPGWIKLML